MNLAEKKLIVVGGKGGVGRSFVTAGLAVSLARAGKKVLAVDATASGGLSRALLLNQSQTSTAGVTTSLEIDGVGLSVLELTTGSSLQEFVDLYTPVPVGAISASVSGSISRVFDYVAKAAPAVREILTIGKIGHEARNGDWDVVIVDGPATGHVVEMLAAPAALAELTDRGPLVQHTEWLDALLSDSSVTAAVLVTTPEELPVNELIELLGRIEAETDLTVGAIVANRLPTLLSKSGVDEADGLVAIGSPLSPALKIVMDRHKTTTEQMARLEELNLPILAVPDAATVSSLVFDAASKDQTDL